jgi:Arc/MetJ-type ribon-helix-helix transcriptional regulator
MTCHVYLEASMNFSIHLPDPLLEQLDAYARSQQSSRSGIIREAVQLYLSRQARQVWPTDLETFMRNPVPETSDHGPDFTAIRAEMNASMRKRVAGKRGA